MANRRRRRGQLIAVLVVVLVAAGIFIVFFCRGPTGLFGLRTQEAEKARLQSEVDGLKVKATVLKSDIDDYHNPEKVKQIAKDKLQMTDPAKADSAK